MALHDNGFKLAETQRDMTPIQMYIYFKARDYHYDDGDSSSGVGNTHMNKLQRFM